MKSKAVLIVALLITLTTIFYSFNRIKILENEVKILSEKVKAVSDEGVKTIEGVSVHRYGIGGVKRYIGDDLFRVEPSESSPFIYSWRAAENGGKMLSRFGNLGPLVEIFRVVYDKDKKNEGWALVTNQRGTIGYVRLSDLIDPIDYLEGENVEIDYEESLGGFYIGDRIEKLIGSLDENFDLVHEESRVYLFSDLVALVTDSNRVHYIRAETPNVKLKSGYKIGDFAKDVLKYYESKYDYLEMNEYDKNYLGELVFNISDNVVLAFDIDSKDITDKSVITEIRIHTIKSDK